MKKRNKKKDELSALLKGATRGTGSKEQVVKFFGSWRKDSNRLTANQIRELWTERLDKRLETRCKKIFCIY